MAAPDSHPSDAEIARRLHEVEAELDLFGPTIDETSAWQLLRAPVARELVRSGATSPGARQSWSRPELVRRCLEDWGRYPRLPRARILVKTFVSALAETGEDGRYRDVFFDDILDVVGSHVKLEVPNARPRAGGARAAHLPPSAATVGADFGAHVLSRLKPSRQSSELAGYFADVIADLGAPAFGRDRVTRRLDSFRWGKHLYGRILDRVRPRFVVVADTGEFELFAAAKQRGIRCVELQHGIFTRDHPDALGVAAAPHRGRVIVPDALLLFGTYWEAELRAGGFYGDELRVAGSPRIDRFRARRGGIARDSDRTCRVLVTSAGVATEELAEFLADTASLARADGFPCRFDLKLHPIYDASFHGAHHAARAGVDDVRLLTAEEGLSTLELLSEADAHVSTSSACHYEALGLGVPTVVLPLPGYEVVMPLVAAGDATLGRSPAELLQALRDVRDAPVPEAVSARYYRPGALARIARELGSGDAEGNG